MKEDFLRQYLEKRREQGTLRELPAEGAPIDFLSNDYLGLARNEELAASIAERWSKDQQLSGGTGSRLLSGNHALYEELESRLAALFQAEAVLVFNSGYQANQSLISAVATKNDVVLYDELAHVCIKEGAWLSRARTFGFRHNDLQDLERRLNDVTASASRVFVVTESLFSMDGDFAPMEEVVRLCERFGALLIVDEAHSTGSYGPQGAGWLVERGLESRVFARVYTFGKAMGSHGACVAGSSLLRDYLLNAARSFIYTTSLPPHSLRSLIEAFAYLGQHPELAEQLHKNIDFFRRTFEDLAGTSASSLSSIQPIAVAGAERSLKVADGLKHAGYQVMAIRAPTVRAGAERLRICLHSYNSEEEIRGLVAAIAGYL